MFSKIFILCFSLFFVGHCSGIKASFIDPATGIKSYTIIARTYPLATISYTKCTYRIIEDEYGLYAERMLFIIGTACEEDRLYVFYIIPNMLLGSTTNFVIDRKTTPLDISPVSDIIQKFKNLRFDNSPIALGFITTPEKTNREVIFYPEGNSIRIWQAQKKD
jgi:hypothetical protein